MNAWPQFLIALWLVGQLLYHLVTDMKEPARSMDRATSVVASFIVFGLLSCVLWAGGFWGPMARAFD